MAGQMDRLSGLGSVGPPSGFCRAVSVTKPVAAARLYICGLGLYQAAWNGRKIGDELLAPYCTNYDGWVQYQTYDITRQVQKDGVLSVTLGNGWYKGRFGLHFDQRTSQPYYGHQWKLIAELHLHYTDGSAEIIGTDENWQVTGSNILFPTSTTANGWMTPCPLCLLCQLLWSSRQREC